MLIKMLTKVFGSSNDRTLRRMRKTVDIINKMEPDFEKLSDEELKAKTELFRERLKKASRWRVYFRKPLQPCVKPVNASLACVTLMSS